MPEPRHHAILDRALTAITFLFVTGGLIALGFLKDLSKENRALIIIISSVGMICSLFGFVVVSVLLRWLRQRIWQKAMSAWVVNSSDDNIAKYDLSSLLSEEEFRRLALQTYSRIGYRIPIDEGREYMRLINPEGRVELLMCKLQEDPMELHHLYSLELEMKRTKAVRGFLWASSGFTSEAIKWVQHRPIVLANRREIGRLIDCARAQGSRLLEYG